MNLSPQQVMEAHIEVPTLLYNLRTDGGKVLSPLLLLKSISKRILYSVLVEVELAKEWREKIKNFINSSKNCIL
jgi:hypothetical protein